MKIRSDFVTNSSSSSYIIAKKSDCTKSDILEMLKGEKDSLKYFVNEDVEYTEYADSFEETKDINNKIELALNYLTDELYNLDIDIKLDDWNVSVTDGSNESENILSMFLYCRCGKIDNNKIKIKCSN